MGLSEKVHLIIYRIREKGLEVFLVNQEALEERWEIPAGQNPGDNHAVAFSDDKLIELDPVENGEGAVEKAYAVEGDWHDIPSLKQMLFEDAQFVKERMNDALNNGTYIAVKEAFKRVLPHQYQFLKELKDIITDRNSVKDI